MTSARSLHGLPEELVFGKLLGRCGFRSQKAPNVLCTLPLPQPPTAINGARVAGELSSPAARMSSIWCL